MMKIKRKVTVGTALLLVILLSVIFYFSPYSTALLKSKAHFKASLLDSAVLYEAGAEEKADRIALILDSAVKRVEEIHCFKFKKPFSVYVCNSQKSLNEYIAHPVESRVRGTVIFGNIFIAPSAFDWNGEDTHRGTLLHELSHLHMRQHLGFWRERTDVPVWFKEGLADYVCDCAGEGISDNEAINAIIRGYHFVPDESGSILSQKNASDYGIDYPMLHKQARMFVTFLFADNRTALGNLLSDIYSGNSFAVSFRNRMGTNLSDAWQKFVKRLSN